MLDGTDVWFYYIFVKPVFFLSDIRYICYLRIGYVQVIFNYG